MPMVQLHDIHYEYREVLVVHRQLMELRWHNDLDRSYMKINRAFLSIFHLKFSLPHGVIFR